MTGHLLLALMFSLGINLTMFLVAFRYKTDKLTDISYALTFIVLAMYGLITGKMTHSNLIIFAMVVVWAARLGSFLMVRIRKQGKDKRFDNMRSNLFAFGRFWVLQAVTVWLVSMPALLAMTHNNGLVGLSFLTGCAVWAAGLLIEITADLQKYQFSTNPGNKDKWIEKGLWSYSRHPNYYGEILVWVGLYIAALPVLSGNQPLLALISPIYITVMLLFVSGIPPLERSANDRWGNDKDYQSYKKRTSLLVIWPNKDL